MLQDYADYLVTLRNNLIQCGVEYPISEVSTYADTMREANELDQVLWFFSIMNASDADCAIKGYSLPIEKTYKDKVKEESQQEFQRYLEDYKSISKLAFLTGDFTSSVLEDDTIIKSPVQFKGSYDEDFDLFGDEPVEDTSVNIAPVVIEETDNKREGMSFFNNLKGYVPPVSAEYVEPKLVIDAPVIFDKSKESAGSSCSFVENGVYLDIVEAESVIDSGGFSENGIFLDDDISENYSDEEYSESGCFLDDCEDVESSNSWYVDEYAYDDTYEEDDSVSNNDEDEEYSDPYAYDNTYEEDDSVSSNDEDEYEEEYSDPYAYDDTYEEDDSVNHSSDEDEDEDFSDPYAYDDTYEDDSIVSTQSKSQVSQPVKQVVKPKKKDLTDDLTDFVSNLATQGKKLVIATKKK